MSYVSTIKSYHMISWMCVGLERKNISCLSHITILMYKRHSLSCIRIDISRSPAHKVASPQYGTIHRSHFFYIVTSVVNCEIVRVNPGKGIDLIKHKIIWPKDIFNEIRIIILSVWKLTWISTISHNRLRGEILHVYAQMKFGNIVRNPEMFSTEWIFLIVVRNK